ncbi:cation diffusion facilitator family transporter [Helicobacter mesocricetorum]|uniref:cation diffusion facilitator family transporter n=1 Tax=Helicobacter mesocricetorum TaxID=87012 RepID=UPI000CF03668|nr:cation transporter [Helicobacter mesocricetorum]
MQLGILTQNYGKKIRQKQLQPIENWNTQEQLVLKASIICAVLLAIFGISFGVLNKSNAIIFDGIVCIVSVGLGLLSLVTSRYIYRKDDDIFQYGYVRFEPMVNFFKSSILMAICIYACLGGIKDIYHGGYPITLGGAITYTCCAFILCLGMYIYTSLYAKKLDSELIATDNVEWLIDSIMYLGGIIAFGIVFIFDYEQKHPLSHYIDPILLVCLSLFLSLSPLKIMFSNLKDLIMVAPKELDDKITQIMESLSLKYGFSDYDTHVAKSGRFFMIEINLLLTNLDDRVSIRQLDAIRDEIENALEMPSYKIWLSISFTANPKWL